MQGEVFDVVIHSTGSFVADVAEFQRHRPPNGVFELSEDCWVGLLPGGTHSDLVFNACGPAGYNFNPTRQFGCRYAVCRRVQPEPTAVYVWDRDSWLRRLLFLSRLIRPTNIKGRNNS